MKKMFKNDYIFALITRITCIVLGFIYTILLSRYLGASLRGEYSIIQNYASIAAAFLGMGIYQAYPFFKKQTKDNLEKEELYENITSNIIGLFIIYLIVCSFLAILLPINLRLKITLIILPLSYLYKQTNYILLIENPRVCNKTEVFLNAFDILFVVSLMIFTDASIWFCLFFLIVDKILYSLTPVINLKINFFKNKPTIDKQLFKYVKYGFLPMLTIFLMTFNHKVDIVMLSLFKNVTTAEIGVYSLGVMLAEKIWMLPDTLTNILQSKLANGKDEKEVAKISRLSSFVTFVCLIFVAIFGKPLIKIAYGNEYIGAYKITLIILFGVLGMVFYKVIYAYNIVAGKKRLNFCLLLISVLLNIILNLFFISNFGVIGAGYASLIAFVLCGTVFLISFSRNTKIKVSDMIFIKRNDIKILKNLLISRKEK